MPTIIFKATEACNCRCSYCDVVTRRAPLTISDEMLRLAFMRFEEYLSACPDESLNVIFHGGEPLVAGERFFNRVSTLRDGMSVDAASRISFTLQTNLTLLTPGLVDSLVALGVKGVGTSYDWYPGMRGLGAARDSRLYNRRFFEGINLLERASIVWGIIYVVTSAVVGRAADTFNHLLNLSPGGRITFNPVLVYHGATPEARETALTGEQYAAFLGEILPLWLQRKTEAFDVEPFASLYRFYTEDAVMLGCNEAENCGPHLYIGPDGSMSQCGRAADWGLIDYGNITENSIASALCHPMRRLLDSRADALLASGECAGCQWWELCHGGCPLDGWDASGGTTFNKRSTQCDWKRIFLRDYFEPVTGLTVNNVNFQPL